MSVQLKIFRFVDHSRAAAHRACDNERSFGRSWLTSFPGRDFATNLVEKVEMKLTLFTPATCSVPGGLQHGEALTVGVQVKVIVARRALGELAGRPQLGFVGLEGITESRVGAH